MLNFDKTATLSNKTIGYINTSIYLCNRKLYTYDVSRLFSSHKYKYFN